MEDGLGYKYPSPLTGYENAPPLPEERQPDKSYVNPARETPSKAYDEFIDPLDKSPRGGFDVHIYYNAKNDEQAKYAKELWERIRREFPELSVYSFWDKAIGPHPVAMFEVNIYTPAQFGAFIPWLAIWRGPLSALIHPNTIEEGSYVRDGSSVQAYLKEPWNHYKRPLESYLSLRFAQKEQFLERLKEKEESVKDWEQVNQEIDRIKTDRSRFLGKSNKQGLERELRNSYWEWKQTVFEPTELQKIAHDREKQVKKKKFGAVLKANLRAWDAAHLKELRKAAAGREKTTDELLRPAQQVWPLHNIDDPYRGFRAGAMYFEKRTSDGSLRGVTSDNAGYQKTEFPNQKIALKDILDESHDNPLRANPNNHVRYFHFPSNNMEWLPYLHWETSSRRAQMVKVINEATYSKNKTKSKSQILPQAVNDFMNMAAENKTSNKSKNKAAQLPRRELLARYLLAVARMAEAMDYEADEVLLRRKVNTKSPLHIRRTLDQYYFLTLDNTSERDRDQVVYRGTRSLSLTTRVVMVDQLWMWILDDHTIITAFPRRWGRNKPDPSGVHKSLRERLRQNTEVIKSTHHLAMIIMDQCSRVFFDRTRPLDDRPEVMDLFAAAIGTVAEKTRIAYDHFWRSIAVDPHYKGPLVINPEGIVLKEAQDIAEELMIMKRVYGEQLKVAKDFMRHLAHPRGRHAAMSDEARLIKRLLIELGSVMRQDIDEEQEHDPLGVSALLDEEPAHETHEAHELVELLQSRLAEILDLEEAALRACSQLEGLLSLKQQQASIVDARAALDTANESYKQGRTIQAFTIPPQLPLGFIAAFFGMNNDEINEAKWMSLWEQIKWMFGGTAVVIFISVSLAFGSWFRDLTAWIRVVLRFSFDVPKALLFQSTEMSRFHEWWKGSLWNSKNLDRKRKTILAGIAKKRREREEDLATQQQEHEPDSVIMQAIPNVFLGRENTEQEAEVPTTGETRLMRRMTTRLGWGPKEDVDEESSV
ncbi:hypothetical protein E8E14_009873 [Neopestalotiopsis sp. 37M]|nr:hypothetical protein E8E14_009873 [Neopestalotiopsis sp. 37M]